MNKSLKLNLLSDWKVELISSMIVLLCLTLVTYFPTQGNLQTFSSALFFLFLLPILYIKFILKQNLNNFGFALPTKLRDLYWSLAMLFVSGLIIFLLLHFFDFEQKYLLPTYLAQSFWSFLFYELILVNFLFFIQEFFFKGFFLFLFAKRFGFWSVFLQGLLFTLFILATRTVWQSVPMLILAFTGGVVAYKTKAFLYSYVMGLFFLIFLDAYIIYLFR